MSIEQKWTANDPLVVKAEGARASWQRVRLWLRSATPSGVAHALLLIAAIAAIGWLVVASWPALLPFAISATVAYAVLPVVNRLDAWMPRPIAALATMAGVVVILGTIVWAIVPPVAQELNRLYLLLRDPEAVATVSAQIDDYLRRLPAPVRNALLRGVDNTVTSVSATIDRSLEQPLQFLARFFLWLVDSIGFALGLLVIPAWLLAVLKDQRAAARALDRLLPRWLAPDFWAVLRLCDRVFGAFVRGQLLLGVAVAAGTWSGLTLLGAIYGPAGPQAGQYAILVALLAGILHLVPVLGPFVALLLAALIGLTFSRDVAILAPLTVLASQVLVQRAIAPHLDRRVSDLHPAILVLAITALGQFGILWIFVAAPIVAIARELYRYTYGRLGDPPLPAGVLPGAAPHFGAATATQPADPRRVAPTNRRFREG